MTRSLFFIAFFNLIHFCSINGQNATINLLLLDKDSGKPLQTNIKWHSLKTNKDFVFKTDKDGKTTALIPSNEAYELAIPQSSAKYTLELPPAPFTKDVVLEFRIIKEQTAATTTQQATVDPPKQPSVTIAYRNSIGLHLLNKPEGKVLEIIDVETQKKVWSSVKDTNNFVLPAKKRYKLVMDGVVIQNEVLDMTNFSPTMLPFIVYFNAPNAARLSPLANNAALNLVYINLKNEPVVGDTITLISKKNGQKFSLKTGQNGSALFVVPKDDIYEIHLKDFPKLSSINVENSPPQYLTTIEFGINYPSAAEVEKFKIDAEKRILERDSLYKLFEKPKELTAPELRESIGVYQEDAKPKLEQDTNYFIKKREVIGSVFYRFRKEWTTKIIVTDVTGSMYPYMKELAHWHGLGLMESEKNAYIFFNDGNNKPDIAKKIGKTGGIYTTKSTISDSIISLMYRAMFNGNGGDTPENNIEALLEAQKLSTSASDIIMIADNFSSIKDLALLSELNKPIHIILCGVRERLHPDYLWLAYKTRGTVHTIEEDIMNLGAMMEGKTVTIKGRTYKLLNNRFFEMR
jgi:hypothetical protein